MTPSIGNAGRAGAVVGLLMAVAGCGDGHPAGLVDPGSQFARVGDPGMVQLCHRPEQIGVLIEVSQAARNEHLAHGDYIATVYVNRQAAETGDGVHFRRIGDALQAVRSGRLERGEFVTAECRITIVVSGEVYPGSVAPGAPDLEQFPLLVDVPAVTLRGALVMGLDAGGRATGAVPEAGETIIAPVDPLPVVAGSSTPLILTNAHPGGSAGHDLIVEGFVLRSGHSPLVSAGGQGVLSVRAERVVIRGNRFEAGFTESIDVRAGSSDVMQNQLGGTAGTCDICLAGPGHFRAIGNKLAAGGVPGIVVSGVIGLPLPAGVEPLVRPATAETWGEVRNNEVRDHLRKPVGVGVRVDALGTAAPEVHNTVHAVIQENLLVNNRFGIIVHGAFPVAGTALRSDVDVTLGGNTYEQTCQAKLLVSLSRHNTALGLASNPWLLNSSFELKLGSEVSWDEAWFGHAAGFGNTLVVDGQVIGNGGRHAYDAVGCPGLQ